MDKNKGKKVTKKTKKLLDKLESQFGNGLKTKIKQNNENKGEKATILRQDQTKQQINNEIQINNSKINTDSSVSKKSTVSDKNNTDKSNNTQRLQTALQSTVLQSSTIVTSKGRVEDFKENAINRKIPVSLQRDVYRQIGNHTTVELIKGFLSLRSRTENLSDEAVQQQYSARIISVRDTKTIQETSARESIQTFSTARRKWMNSSERKQLLHESLSTAIQFSDYQPLHQAWIQYFTSLQHEEIDLSEIIAHLPRDGCLLKVISSSLPQDVGIEGIVLYEGENMFILITNKNQVKRVLKKGHVFRVLGVNQSITLFGDLLDTRSVFQQEKQWSRLFASQKHIYNCLFYYYKIQFIKKVMAASTFSCSTNDWKVDLISSPTSFNSSVCSLSTCYNLYNFT